jgi:HKD family nuclease
MSSISGASSVVVVSEMSAKVLTSTLTSLKISIYHCYTGKLTKCQALLRKIVKFIEKCDNFNIDKFS